MKKLKTHQLTAVGLMSALVLMSTFLKIPIPVGTGTSMIHLGNVFCVISALLLGPFMGGLACGIGSFLFDLLNPAYIASAPFTLIFKFIMGFVCGSIAYANKKNADDNITNIVAASVGLVIYVFLRLLKGFITYRYILGININTCTIILCKTGAVSLINAVIAVAIAVPLAAFVKKSLAKVGIVLYRKR